jgi:predicted metal-dependent hydrolase
MSADKQGSGAGCSPHFQMDLLNGEDGGENGCSPHSPHSPHSPGSPLIRVSARARRLSVRVFPDARVEVVVPPRVRPKEVEDFLSAHREWIDDRRARALRDRPPPEVFPPAEVSLGLTGETWRIHMAGGQGAPRIVERRDGILAVSGRATDAALRAALRAWLLRAARRRLTPRVAALAGITGVPYSKVSIRRQRSRWGSCSVRGTISLNASLLFQRPEVVDYLIVHELMHVKHMNHSARFWQAVERHCPGWRPLDRELLQGWRNVPRWIFSEGQAS